MAGLRPVGKRVVIEPIAAETTTASGLVIPDSARQAPQEAIVISVSSEIENADVKVGDKVIYSIYGGTSVSMGSRTYLVMEIADLIAVVE
jgi:chaperonin GroES